MEWNVADGVPTAMLGAMAAVPAAVALAAIGGGEGWPKRILLVVAVFLAVPAAALLVFGVALSPLLERALRGLTATRYPHRPT